MLLWISCAVVGMISLTAPSGRCFIECDVHRLNIKQLGRHVMNLGMHYQAFGVIFDRPLSSEMLMLLFDRDTWLALFAFGRQMCRG